MRRRRHSTSRRPRQRRVLWPPPGADAAEIEREPDSLLPFLSAASIQGHVALGPGAARRIERLGHRPRDARSLAPSPLCTAIDGFSLHTRVHVQAHERERLDKRHPQYDKP